MSWIDVLEEVARSRWLSGVHQGRLTGVMLSYRLGNSWFIQGIHMCFKYTRVTHKHTVM